MGSDSFAHGGIGKKGADNGVLLLVAPHERKARIEVGRRLQPLLTDAIASRIIRNDMRPYTSKNDFGGAMVSGAEAIMAILAPQLKLEGQEIMSHAMPKEDTGSGVLVKFLIALLVVVGLGGLGVILSAILKSTQKRAKTAGRSVTEEIEALRSQPHYPRPRFNNGASTQPRSVSSPRTNSTRSTYPSDDESLSRPYSRTRSDDDNSGGSSNTTISGGDDGGVLFGGGDAGGGGASTDI
jgi:uncharacterized protein